jgi:arylsulfatase A-like enzyme
MVFDRAFDARRVKHAIVAYFALVTFVDQNIGARGLWGKSTFYEESAGVPLIMAGPDIRAIESAASR